MYNKANNEYKNEVSRYKDKNESSKNIIYLDANDMYEWAMNQHIPTAGFKCSTQDEI